MITLNQSESNGTSFIVEDEQYGNNECYTISNSINKRSKYDSKICDSETLRSNNINNICPEEFKQKMNFYKQRSVDNLSSFNLNSLHCLQKDKLISSCFSVLSVGTLEIIKS